MRSMRLRPVYSSEALRRHFELHKTYVEALNKAMKDDADASLSQLEKTVEHVSEYSSDVRFFCRVHIGITLSFGPS